VCIDKYQTNNAVDMGKPAVFSNTLRKTYTYSTWRNAELHKVKVGGKCIYHHGLMGQKMTIFVVCLITSENESLFSNVFRQPGAKRGVFPLLLAVSRCGKRWDTFQYEFS